MCCIVKTNKYCDIYETTQLFEAKYWSKRVQSLMKKVEGTYFDDWRNVDQHFNAEEICETDFLMTDSEEWAVIIKNGIKMTDQITHYFCLFLAKTIKKCFLWNSQCKSFRQENDGGYYKHPLLILGPTFIGNKK